MMKYIKKYPFQVFLFLHCVFWSLLPLMRKALPMDSIEAISWGRYCDFGTNKHPPLSGWLAYFFYDVIGFQSPYAVYLLSQICVLIGFIYIYRLARGFLSKDRAIFSVMLLEGVIYYGFSAIEYNVNVVSLALWPMCAFYFYRALKKDALKDWALTGLLAGLNLFNKYTSALLLFSMFAFMIYNKNAREKLKTFKPYFAAFICLLVFLPHLLWLYFHDFEVLSYFVGRSTKGGFENFAVLKHILWPIKFAGAQVLFCFMAVVIYFVAQFREKRLQVKATRTQKDFLLIMGLMPVCLVVLISFVLGIKLKSMWGFPCAYMIGVLAFVFYPVKLTDAFKKKLYLGVYGAMLWFLLAQGLIIALNKSDKFQLNAKDLGQRLEQIWYERNGRAPLEYVAGDVWWANNVSLFAPSKPKPIIWGDLKKNPWFDQDDVAQKGALVVAPSLSEYNGIRKKMKFMSAPQSLDVFVENRLGKVKKKVIYYGFYNVFGVK